MMRIRNFFTLIILFYSLHAFAQDKGVFNGSVTVYPLGTGSKTIQSITTLNKQVKRASALVRSDFGGNYYFGMPGEGADFSLRVSFVLKGYLGSTVAFSKGYSFDVDNSHPEGYLSRDLKEFIVTPGSLRQTGLDIDKLEISSVTVTDLRSGGSYSTARDQIRLQLSYEIEYGLDTRLKGSDITLFTPSNDSPKSRLFQWQSSNPYPNYQFQLLRLYNVNEANKSEGKIEAVVDWTKAVTIETESASQQLSLTIAEGTGYYVWRVRPIGTYFEGGIANSNNWGDWNSPSPASGETVSLPQSGEKFFFFTDPDEDKNYIYSRTFSEENKVKESSTYANKLLQTKQSQVYIPSDNTTVTSQTIQDHLGRPAMQTMPVPVDGRPDGYKENFVKTGDHLYTEKDFDTDAKLKDPSPVDNSSQAGSYYNGSTAPSAQGYPFSRVLFYDDGTGRVKEQSGVGKDHMVGDQNAGKGRTVRTMYGTPSEDELVRLFGKEAPNHERVQKVITVDQNNIASISYTGADGKTIATALTFYDNDNQTLLPLSSNSSIGVKDKLAGGVKTNDAYVGAKRLVFTQPTTFAAEYMVECQTFSQICADVEVNCNYKVIVKVTNVETGVKYTLSKSIKDIGCGSITICGKTSEYKVVLSSQWDGSIPTLEPGTYIVEKRLEPAGDIKVELKNIKEKTEAQVKPFRDWIIGSLQNVQCPAQLDTFYHNLVAFSKFVRTQSLDSAYNKFECEGCSGGVFISDTFWTIYSNPNLTPGFEFRVYNKDGLILDNPYGSSPIAVFLKTPCCDELKLDVTYNPPFKCPPTTNYVLTAASNRPAEKGGNNTKLDVNYDFLTHPEYTEYFPDFEGYAISTLMECGNRDTAAAKDIFYTYMAGWKEGEFNMMIHHMLTDKYDCNGTGLNAPEPGDKWNTEPKAPDACTPASQSMIPNTQYRCADLARCWTNLVQLMSQSYCQSMDDILSEMKTNGTVSDGFDNQQEGGSGDKHDGTFDGAMDELPGLVRWLAKKKMSARLRKMQMAGPGKPEEPQYVFHMVDMFLRCGGYKFADILEPSAQGNCGANGTAPAVFKVPSDFDGNLANGEYNSCPYKSTNWGDTPVETGQEGLTRKVKDLFPNIQNPIYAFKYFEYKEETFPNLEAITCFRDPNDCYYINSSGQKVVVPCCGDTSSSLFFCVKEYNHPRPNGTDQIGPYKWLVKDFCGMGKIICPYLHDDWNCMERLAFFNMLKGYRELEDSYEPDPVLTCSWMTTPRQWYELPDKYKDSTSLDYVDRDQFKRYTGDYPEDIDPTVNPTPLLGLMEVNGKTHYMFETPKEQITYVEYIANKKRKSCVNNCESRRDEFRTAVMQMFIDRCYVFEGCKRSNLDNIIYPEDIEKIVDRIVLECQTQCPLTTYTCQTNQCRLFTTPYDEIGPNDEEAKMELGTGGHPDRTADCPAGVGKMKNCCTNTSGTPPVTMDGMECNSSYSLSFYEQTNYLQAKEWELKLDIVSMCNSNGVYVDADNNGERDNYVLYYYNKNAQGQRVLLQQNQSGLICTPRPPGNTFVEKSEYDVRTTTPLPQLKTGTPVYSPKIGFTINGGN